MFNSNRDLFTAVLHITVNSCILPAIITLQSLLGSCCTSVNTGGLRLYRNKPLMVFFTIRIFCFTCLDFEYYRKAKQKRIDMDCSYKMKGEQFMILITGRYLPTDFQMSLCC